jgi:hypothetical protein
MDESQQRMTLRIFQVAFWLAFAITPFFTGWLEYRWLPNESFNPTVHKALSSYDSDHGEIVDQWQNEATGKVYSRESYAFHKHREHEARRLSIVWFAYGGIGRLFYAITGLARRSRRFLPSFGKAMLINIASAIYVFFVT